MLVLRQQRACFLQSYSGHTGGSGGFGAARAFFAALADHARVRPQLWQRRARGSVVLVDLLEHERSR